MQLSLSTPSTAVAEKQSLVRTPDEGAPSGVDHEPAADEAKLLVRWKQQVGAFLVFLVARSTLFSRTAWWQKSSRTALKPFVRRN